MPEKKPSQGPPSYPKRLRPGQDIVVVRKQAAQFPAVGMTLNTYRQSSTPGAQAAKRSSFAAPQPSRWGRFRQLFTLKRCVLSLLVIALLIGGWVGGKFIYNAHKLFGGNLFSVFTTTKLRGESSGRINILLAGNSADDPGHQGANLTDSIMIMSIDTKHNTAFLLSVPRDLWVHIPGGGYQKINDAYVVGQNDNFNQGGYFSGGMGELQQIVQADFGIQLDYYALVDYSALRDAVNAVGGITVNIQSSDPRGLYDRSIDYTTHGPLVRLTNGEHLLNGQQALDLARARGDAYGSYGFPQSDFNRTANQRLMLVALKDKATSLGVLANPAKLSSLSDAIGNNVTTDFSLSEVHRLYDLVKPIKSNNIRSLSLNSANGQDLLTSYQASNGESALIPAGGLHDFSAIRAYVAQQTSSNPAVQEGAKIVLLNATNESGLAAKEQSKLTNEGFDVVAVGDARTNQAATSIIDNSAGKLPSTRQFLQYSFGNDIGTVNPYASAYKADFIVLLGSDQVPSGQSGSHTN